MSEEKAGREISVWWFAFGYFAAYAPYSMLTKVISSGLLKGNPAVNGTALLSFSTLATLVTSLSVITILGWWKFASHKKIGSLNVPVTSIWTFLSGICTASIIATTTLSYTIKGVSIVFMMIIMRGGVFILAPIVDTICKRKISLNSWIALGLSLVALSVQAVGKAKGGDSSFSLPVEAIIILSLYLGSYFIRMLFMTKRAKSKNDADTKKYFVEEQMVATPALVLFLLIAGLCGRFGGFGKFGEQIHWGYTAFFSESTILVICLVALIGILSTGTGIFGTLIYLGNKENTFCVPVNRCSSLLAGVLATFLVWQVFDGNPPAQSELISAAILIVAIIVLCVKLPVGKKNCPHCK